jgi:1-aminocyclopropane-1-carboxylate deaminase
MVIEIRNVPATPIITEATQAKNISLNLLRLDLLHPIISGNKWLKLQPYLIKFIDSGCTSIASCGGAFSNYLHALAYWCHLNEVPCKCIIRGEQVTNPTLNDMIGWGAQLEFLARTEFDELAKQSTAINGSEFWIPFGAYEAQGLYASNLLLQNYVDVHHLVCAVGTGTTLQGLINAQQSHQKVHGVLAVKDEGLINQFAGKAILHTNTIGKGFGKITDELIAFIMQFKMQHHVLLDVVYTAKMMQAIFAAIDNNEFENNTSILCVHTGGTQGNRSVPELLGY